MPFLPPSHVFGGTDLEVQQVGTICSWKTAVLTQALFMAKFAFTVFITKRLVEDGLVFLIRS